MNRGEIAKERTEGRKEGQNGRRKEGRTEGKKEGRREQRREGGKEGLWEEQQLSKRYLFYIV